MKSNHSSALPITDAAITLPAFFLSPMLSADQSSVIAVLLPNRRERSGRRVVPARERLGHFNRS
ncbi:hypothetical protein MesoLjLc_15910 [Mesorhizobium sp. L-8-10]|nr:hypothetical protein MesoLjLb_17520 [Mesorhizobium sp. L-8-3]BCH29661.1 hypothetical protein MesoLjLc_15910 [Mesorhizobium sp. L-8-10]